MPYETPISIKTALKRIDDGEYVLPAIQREFVWRADRIERLFDSLMRGYPIGGFLLWKLEKGTVGELDLYKFLDRYSEFNHRHNERLSLMEPKQLHAVLDGQQRLTALNIALRGTFAYRLARKWADKAENYPERRLHLEIARPDHLVDSDDRGAYRFEFLRAGEADARNSAEEHWFPVPGMLNAPGIVQLHAGLQEAGLSGAPLNRALETLERLKQVIETDLTVASHVEEDQDLDRVLDIFIRVNSAGMTLSSSDLLLSIATARWKERDARESIHSLTDELNATGGRFAFTKDQVLKAALVLTDATDIRFKASNINPQTMAKVEQAWDEIESSLKLAAETLSRFGFNAHTLTAHSVVIPIADWLHQRKLGSNWLSSVAFASERNAMRRWVLRSLLKRGVWGSGLDTLLVGLRRAVREEQVGFPVAALESEMSARGKSLAMSAEEIDALTRTTYGDSRAFMVLAVLYPGFDGSKAFHVDHVFPRAKFRKPTLTVAGLTPQQCDEAIASRDGIANLQLLEQGVNVSKQATLPAEWVATQFPDDASRHAYFAAHDLAGLPDGFAGFLDFYEVRRSRIRHRLELALGVDNAADMGVAADVQGPEDQLGPL